MVAETFAGRLTAFDIAEDGALGNRRVWAQFGETPQTDEVGKAVELLEVAPTASARTPRARSGWPTRCTPG